MRPTSGNRVVRATPFSKKIFPTDLQARTGTANGLWKTMAATTVFGYVNGNQGEYANGSSTDSSHPGGHHLWKPTAWFDYGRKRMDDF